WVFVNPDLGDLHSSLQPTLKPSTIIHAPLRRLKASQLSIAIVVVSLIIGAIYLFAHDADRAPFHPSKEAEIDAWVLHRMETDIEQRVAASEGQAALSRSLFGE